MLKLIKELFILLELLCKPHKMLVLKKIFNKIEINSIWAYFQTKYFNSSSQNNLIISLCISNLHFSFK